MVYIFLPPSSSFFMLFLQVYSYNLLPMSVHFGVYCGTLYEYCIVTICETFFVVFLFFSDWKITSKYPEFLDFLHVWLDFLFSSNRLDRVGCGIELSFLVNVYPKLIVPVFFTDLYIDWFRGWYIFLSFVIAKLLLAEISLHFFSISIIFSLLYLLVFLVFSNFRVFSDFFRKSQKVTNDMTENFKPYNFDS